MLFNMERTERGSSFQIKNLDFESGEATLIGNYDSVLTDYVMMFRNHPEVNFLVKGYVQSYGVNAEADMLLSLERAKSIKEWFVKNGVDAKRITTAGMTKNEIKRAAAAALNEKGGGFSSVKAELIITGKGDN
jgi:outer membrane protein OmpA-like peptidoglycan-associated protein